MYNDANGFFFLIFSIHAVLASFVHTNTRLDFCLFLRKSCKTFLAQKFHVWQRFNETNTQILREIFHNLSGKIV